VGDDRPRAIIEEHGHIGRAVDGNGRRVEYGIHLDASGQGAAGADGDECKCTQHRGQRRAAYPENPQSDSSPITLILVTCEGVGKTLKTRLSAAMFGGVPRLRTPCGA